MKAHRIEQAVRYVETDRMKVVHHSTYLYWFEIGRTALLEEAGYPYHELERSGTLFPVVEYACRMAGSADYGDRVQVETTVAALRSRSVAFTYKVFNRGELIATGTTKHVSVDANHKTHRMSDALIKALETYVDVT
jgi:acyl-CoA thioester hydrolase